MHIFFSGIGGSAHSGLALIAKQAGYEVSGSDIKDSEYIRYLRGHGIRDIYIGQDRENIAAVHAKKPIDWFVYTSALPAGHPELNFCKERLIRTSKRDEFLNNILSNYKLRLIAIAGTHGKTTTAAMAIWLFKRLGMPSSYLIGAKTSFGELANLDPKSRYFVYECDEFDRNFLAFRPYVSIISGLGWDHHEIFPTEKDYLKAFRQFVNQSARVIIWQSDARKLNLLSNFGGGAEDPENPAIDDIELTGSYNRRDAWLVVRGLSQISGKSPGELVPLMKDFPGVSRRFEKLTDNLYTDYAHTPEKIAGALDVAKETLRPNQKLVVVYEPLTNRRMHYTIDRHSGLFQTVSQLYWLPSFLAREDPNQALLSPAQLIEKLDEHAKSIARPMRLDGKLEEAIKSHLSAGDMVLALSGGGAGSLDEWLRREFG